MGISEFVAGLPGTPKKQEQPAGGLSDFVAELPSLEMPKMTDSDKLRTAESIGMSNAFGIPLEMAVSHHQTLKDTVKSNPKLQQTFDSTYSAWKESYNQGYGEINESLWYHELIKNPDNEEALEAIALIEKNRPKQKEPANVAQDFIASAGRLAPFMVQGFKYGANRGALLGGGAALASAATGLGVPVTVPLAAGMYAVGQVSGTAEYAYKVESGAALKEMFQYKDDAGNRIDPSIARATATGIGVLNAAIELAQVQQLLKTIPGGEKLMSGAIRKVGTDLAKKRVFQNMLARFVKRHGTFVGLQTLEEAAQESVTIAGEELAKEITGRLEGVELQGSTPEEIGARIRETMVESAKGFTVIGLPGNTVSSYLDGKTTTEQQDAQATQEADGEQVEPDLNDPQKIGDFDVTEDDILKAFDGAVSTVEQAELDEFIEASPARKAEMATEWSSRTRYNSIKSTFAEAVGEEQADAAMQLFEARAAAAGYDSAEAYLESRGVDVVSVSAVDFADDNDLQLDDNGPKGAAVFAENKAIINLFETADFSTLVHESGHIFRRDLAGNDLAVAEAWAGVKDSKWQVEHEEKFARAFEKYLSDGNAPSTELQTVFQKFKAWLSDIYKTINGSSIDVNVSDDIRQVFDNLLTESEQVDAGIATESDGVLLQTVHHGSPHVWDTEPGFPHGRPRLDKMGTGEGAQVYGWGWYSAENIDVAKNYAPRDLDYEEELLRLYGEAESREDYVSMEVYEAAMQHETPTEMRESYTEENGYDADFVDAVQPVIDKIAKLDISNFALYKLDIPDKYMGDLIDWDAPITEDEAQLLLDEAEAQEWDESSINDILDAAGMSDTYQGQPESNSTMYGLISSIIGSDKEASEFYSEAGIPGNKYLDQGSRADGNGTFNYVIWDQEVLDEIALLERNGSKLESIKTLFQKNEDPGPQIPPQYGELEASAPYPMPPKHLVSEYNRLREEAAVKGEIATEKRFEAIEQQLLRDSRKTAKSLIKDHPVLAAMDEAIRLGGLSYDQFEVDYGKEAISELTRKRPGILSRKSKVAPDEFATDHGFDSLDQMVEAFLAAPAKKDYVDDLAAQIFEEQIQYDQQARDELTETFLAEEEAAAMDELSSRPVFRKELKGIIREQTGQTRRAGDPKNVTEYEAYLYALNRAAQAAKKAHSEGNKKGEAKERARMQAIVDRMKDRHKTSGNRRELKRKIMRQLSQSKLVNGRSNFGPEAQEKLDFFRKAINMTNVKLEEAIANNIASHQDPATALPLEIVEQNEIMDIAIRFGKMDEQELKVLLDQILAFKKENREFINEQRQAQKDAWDVDRNKMALMVYGEKGYPAGIETTGEQQLTAWERIKQSLKNTGLPFLGWKDILDVLSYHDKESGAYQSWISQRFDLLGTKNKEKAGIQFATRAIADAAKQIYGLKNEAAVWRKFMKDAEEVNLGTFENSIGFKVELKLSKAQARKRVMELLDPSLAQKFAEDMRWTPEIVEAIRGFLDPQDEQFIAWQMDFYQQYYNGINEVYRLMTGTNLPQNQFYSPIAAQTHSGKQGGGDGLVSDFLHDITFRSSVKAGSTIGRVQHSNPLSLQSDIVALQRHIAEMEHYKAFAPVLRDFQSVILDPQVQQAIRLTYGGSLNDTIDFFLRQFARNGTETAKSLGWLDIMRGNIVRATLAVKPSLTIKQLTSFPAYFEAVPLQDIPTMSRYMVEFWLNPVENFRMLRDASTMLQTRGDNMERDIKTASKSPIIKGWQASPSFLNMLMANIHLGDQGAIAWGGWAYYKYLTEKKGLSHEAAIAEFESFSESTQQSADLTEQSVFQQGNSLQKLLTMYQSSPIQYVRKEIGAVRNMTAGRISTTDMAKTLVIFHIILPVFFQWVSDRFEWEEDEQARAMLLGPLNSIFLIGEGLSHIVGRMLGTQFNDFELPIYAPFKDLSKAIQALTVDDITSDDVAKAVRGAAGFTGSVTGLPTKQAVDMTSGVVDVLGGDVEKGVTKIMGWSPYKAEELTK